MILTFDIAALIIKTVFRCNSYYLFIMLLDCHTLIYIGVFTEKILYFILIGCIIVTLVVIVYLNHFNLDRIISAEIRIQTENDDTVLHLISAFHF